MEFFYRFGQNDVDDKENDASLKKVEKKYNHNTTSHRW